MDEALVVLAPDELEPWPALNPRTHFNPDELVELEASIREKGVRQPLAVHETGARVKWIVAGERRWRAAKAAGVQIPCLVATYTLAEALEVALLENLQRQSMRPIEEARGFRRWLDETGLPQDDLAGKIGKSQAYVSNRLRLLELPEPIQRLVDDGVLQASYARDMLLPWTKEPAAIGERFFRVLAQHVSIRTDFAEPIQKAWLAGVVSQIGAIVRPAKSAEAKAPPPAAASTPAATPAAPPRSKPEASPDPEPAPTAVDAEESAVESPTPTPADTPPVAEPTENIPEIILAAQEEEAEPEAAPEPPTQPPAAPVQPAGGLLAALLPLLPEYTVTLGVTRKKADAPIMVTVAPRRIGRGGPVVPLVVSRPPEEIEAALVEALRPLIANLTAAA